MQVNQESHFNKTTVAAQEFILKDSSGNTRAIWGLDAREDPVFTLLGADDESGVEIKVTYEGSPQISLFHSDADSRINLSVCACGSATIDLGSDHSGKRVLLTTHPNAEGRISVSDARGQERVLLEVDEAGEGTLIVADQNGCESSVITASGTVHTDVDEEPLTAYAGSCYCE